MSDHVAVRWACQICHELVACYIFWMPFMLYSSRSIFFSFFVEGFLAHAKVGVVSLDPAVLS